MNKADYIFFNRTVSVLFVITVIIFALFGDRLDVSCNVRQYTGKPCGSCGLTRDFLNFVKLEFHEQVNPISIYFFIYLVVQVCYRTVISLDFINEYIPKGSKLKMVITIDIVITILIAIIILSTFYTY